MIVISTAELRNNLKKYLDLARTERVVIQRGRDESFVLIAQNNAPDADLARAITVDEFIDKVRDGLTQLFERKEAEKSV
jgi:Phd_YefM.